MNLSKKIYEAINTGIQKALSFEIEDDNDDFKIKKSSIKSSNLWVYEQYQEKYKDLIGNRKFRKCLDLYNSGYLNQKPRTIGYKPESKEDLQELVKNFDSEEYDNFDLNWIYVSEITDMSELFKNLENFNCNISEWDVSNVTNMHSMFISCENFNQDLSQWDVSKVKNMSHMFCNCKNFNSDLSQWNVSNVTNMCWMFNKCCAFNKPLNMWDVSEVKDMSHMFSYCKFNQPLSNWDVSNVKNTRDMFACSNFNQDISKWDISCNYLSSLGMFYKCNIEEKYKPEQYFIK